jgi:hypothetical protein
VGSPYGSRAPCDDIPQNYVAVGIASEEPGILAPKPYGVNLGTMTSEDVCWLRRWFGLNGRHYLVEEWHAELSFRRADSLLSLSGKISILDQSFTASNSSISIII